MDRGPIVLFQPELELDAGRLGEEQVCEIVLPASQRVALSGRADCSRAKRLLDETNSPMTEVAMLAGFGSLRRFNTVFAEVYGRAPSEIRRVQSKGAPLAQNR